MDAAVFSHHIVSGPGPFYSSYRRAEVAIFLGDFATFSPSSYSLPPTIPSSFCSSPSLPFFFQLTPYITRTGTTMSGSEGPDPILLTLFANRFMSVAEAMGRSLQQTSISTNIKERLDFSCALFAPDGDLVANAPFIPIHLGSMSLCVSYIYLPHPVPIELLIVPSNIK